MTLTQFPGGPGSGGAGAAHVLDRSSASHDHDECEQGQCQRSDTEQPEGGPGVDLPDHPAEVHPEETGDEGELQKDRRHDCEPVGRLVELHLERVRERIAGGVDPVDPTVELGQDALEVLARVGLEARHLLDLLADPLEQAALRPDPQRRSVVSPERMSLIWA